MFYWKYSQDSLLTFFMPIFPAYRNQSIDLQCKSIDWFLCEGNIGMKKFNVFLALTEALTWWKVASQKFFLSRKFVWTTGRCGSIIDPITNYILNEFIKDLIQDVKFIQNSRRRQKLTSNAFSLRSSPNFVSNIKRI